MDTGQTELPDVPYRKNAITLLLLVQFWMFCIQFKSIQLSSVQSDNYWFLITGQKLCVCVCVSVSVCVLGRWVKRHYINNSNNNNKKQKTEEICSFSSVQSLSHVWLFETPWTAACQVSLSFTISRSLLKLMSIESAMPSNHLILCRPLLLPPSVLPSIRVFANESFLCIRWPKYLFLKEYNIF